MSAAFNSSTGAVVSGASVSSLTVNTMTVGSGPNRALIVVLTAIQGTLSGVTMTWDSGGTNQAMTQIQSRNDGVNVIFQFGLLNPAAGNLTLLISWTGATQLIATAADFTGVEQSNITNAFINKGANFFGSTGSTVTTNVTSAVGDIPIACFEATGVGLTFSGATQTEFGNGAAAIGITSECQYAAGAASVSFSITPSITGTVFGASFDIVASADSLQAQIWM